MKEHSRLGGKPTPKRALRRVVLAKKIGNHVGALYLFLDLGMSQDDLSVSLLVDDGCHMFLLNFTSEIYVYTPVLSTYLYFYRSTHECPRGHTLLFPHVGECLVSYAVDLRVTSM